MITATIRDNGFRIEGHANMAPNGQDVVCASVSALVGGLIRALEELSVNFEIQEADQRKGIIDLKIKTMTTVVECVVSVLEQGLLNIQLQYPDYVKVVSDE